MSKISKLERAELGGIYSVLKKIGDSHVLNSDSIWDLIFEQLDMEVSDDDKPAFEAALSHCRLMMDESEKAKERLQVLIEHFDQ